MSVKTFISRHPRAIRALALVLPLALVGATKLPWTELTEADWLYSLATRFASLDGHRVHYPTPPAELAKLLEGRKEAAALRHLADTRLELGDRPGALAAMEAWAKAEGAAAWDETARWAAAHQEWPLAFRAAETALPGLPEAERHGLADLRITWAEAHPDHADALALRGARARLFPADAEALENWLRALEKADRLDEADKALAATQALSPERRLLLRSDLAADHGKHLDAFRILDEAVAQSLGSGAAWSPALRKAYAVRVDKAAPASPASWRTTLDRAYSAEALVRLATYFQGQQRGDAAADLLQQVERRFGGQLGRTEFLLLARLYREIDAVPDAFRARLAAAQAASAEDQKGDLAELAHLSLRAGGRPLALGTYNDEAYHWAARVDRTPGFWTGGVSFLLTGLPWKNALDRLETDSLPDRTFATARALEGELALRAPQHPELPALRVAIMERHVERGEGQAALDLLPLLASASPATHDEARRVALLALRQVQRPLAEEVALMQARLKFLAPDGSRPALSGSGDASGYDEDSGYSDYQDNAEEPGESRSWMRIPRESRPKGYAQILQECIQRLEHRDRSHVASLGLILAELDRLPDAEELWLSLASRLENWNLDEALGPRYESALERFKGPGLWPRLARWHARRSHHTELRSLAETIAQRFRSSELFSRLEGAGDIRMEIPEQPRVHERIRLVPWADWVRYKALERFPQSPSVYRAASHLMTESQWAKIRDSEEYRKARPSSFNGHGSVVIPDQLMETRRWALFFQESGIRERYLDLAMHTGSLESTLTTLSQKSGRTPVEDLLLFEGWVRLSRFEQAFEPADRLLALYPGDGALAQRVLSLHRSLGGLTPGLHAGLARTLVERTAPALEDAGPLWTELGELEEDRGRPEAAMATWKHVLARSPRNPEKISELATLLWDYNHDAEALAVVEEGRKRLDRPRFFAFETGVLRENLKDLEGAVQEYLNALRAEGTEGYGFYDSDQRSLRRLAQLLGRDKVYRLVERRIQGLKPGVREDERALAAFFPLATLELPTPEQLGGDDDWIDRTDKPNDAVGRAQEAEAREKTRPREYDAITRIGDLMLAKVVEMTPRATAPEFLDAAEAWSLPLTQKRWEEGRVLSLRNAAMARRSELTPSEEARIQMEMARADFLAQHRLAKQADEVWAALGTRISALPEGVTKLRAEAARAGYLDRTKGVEEAAAEWRRLSARYPWSLGLLEDRLDFLQSRGKGEEARTLLEGAVAKAAEGHREALLQRLTQDSLNAGDLPRARRAVQLLLAEKSLDDGRRLGALHLLARLSLREKRGWDALAAAREESAKLPPDSHGDLYFQLARAADLESDPGLALSLWIEALNRRTDRAWLQAACRSAQKGGKAAELLAFFEKQRQRSPRDVRWAVAVRDIKRDLHQVEGAIQAAQSAVAVRPEREDLWREAVELMVRGDRIKDAADYLEGWNKPRPADENVARWRSELYARAGEIDRALAVETATLEAFRKEKPQETREHEERQARAAERLLALGMPSRAIRIYAASGDIAACRSSRLSIRTQSTLALLTGQFLRLLSQHEHTDEFLQGSASVLARQGRPEQQEEVLAYVLAKVWPRTGTPQDSALTHWWPFLANAGLEPELRVALAQQYVASRPGPWQTGAPLPFLQAVGETLITARRDAQNHTIYEFRSPELAPIWMNDLARRDRPEELAAFLEPRWQELMAELKKPAASSKRLYWATWMENRLVLETWARGAAKRPEKAQELAFVMSDRAIWDRFWALAARGWSSEPLVALLPESSRLAWFRLWERTPKAQDPLLVARAQVVEKTTLALARLLKGEAQAADAPEILRLRGPQTVGEVLGKGQEWLWPEFKVRRSAAGQIAESGDDRVTGSGVDEGRLPGALWGERPGEAWYVLETLARYRKGDPTAPLVPQDVPLRGGETDRTLLAIRLAKAQKNLPLALEFEQARPGALGDKRRLEARISLLMAAERREEALESLRAFVKHIQPKLNESDFRWTEALSREHGLPPAMELLDPETPVGPAFRAYLVDRQKEAAERFHTADPTGFRAALASRWSSRERQLTPEQIRYWLNELWILDAARLPARGLPKLGGLWSHAAPWLQSVPVPERREAIQALEAFGRGEGRPKLFELLDRSPGDTAALLAVRGHLLRGELPLALERVDKMLASQRGGAALSLSAYTQEGEPEPGYGSRGEEDSEGEDQGDVQAYLPSDALVTRLSAWLVPFQDAKNTPPVEERFRRLLKERREEGAVSTEAWRFAFRLTPVEERAALAAELDAAWFRGEVAPAQLGALCQILAVQLPAETPRWLARWPQAWDWSATRERAAVYATLQQPEPIAKLLVDARRRAPWDRDEELKAFDFWRRNGAGSAAEVPAPWRDALPFWTGKPEGITAALEARLKAHPFDALSSRAALRSLAPADEQTMLRVARSLENRHASGEDLLLLDLRAMRSLLPQSWRAAAFKLQEHEPDACLRVMVSHRMKTAEINATLCDLARLAERKGEDGLVRKLLAQLDERRAPELKALRAELSREGAPSLLTYRMVDGRPTAIRPRDLTWAIMAQVLKAEGVR